MKQVLIFAAIFATCASCTAQEASVEKLLAQSEPAIQKQIKKIVDVLELTHADPGSKIPAFREAQTLMKSVTVYEEIVEQVAIFAATPTSDEHQPLKALAVLCFLDLPPETVISVLAPYLDSDNKSLRSFVREWFQSHGKGGSGTSPLKPVNFEDYADYVRRKTRKDEEVPTAFVEYIYERSPDRALLVFYQAARQDDTIAKLMELRKEQEARQREREKNGDTNAELLEMRKRFEAFHRGLRKNGQETLPIGSLPPVTNSPDEIPRQQNEKPQKEILLAAHIVSNAIWLNKNKFDERFQKALPEAKQQLSKLSKHDKWWVRLYVAEIMRRHRELRQADVLEKLSHDSNVLVRNSANTTAD